MITTQYALHYTVHQKGQSMYMTASSVYGSSEKDALERWKEHHVACGGNGWYRRYEPLFACAL